MTDIERRVRRLIAAKFGVNEADLATDTRFLDDLRADSLDTVELVLMIEDEFQVDIPDDEAAHLSTIRQTIAYLAVAAETEPQGIQPQGIRGERPSPRELNPPGSLI